MNTISFSTVNTIRMWDLVRLTMRSGHCATPRHLLGNATFSTFKEISHYTAALSNHDTLFYVET